MIHGWTVWDDLRALGGGDLSEEVHQGEVGIMTSYSNCISYCVFLFYVDANMNS